MNRLNQEASNSWQNIFFLQKECECYEEEVQPYRKTDYKPIIYICIYLYFVRALLGVLMLIFCICVLKTFFRKYINLSTKVFKNFIKKRYMLLIYAFRNLWKEWGDCNFQIFTELPVPP